MNAAPRHSGQRSPQRRSAPQAGLTLIEVLVAVTLMALLAAGMTTALSMGAGSWSDVRERLTINRKIAASNQLLHAHFSAVVPVVTGSRRAGVGRRPFFHGEGQQMRFVSSYSSKGGVRGGLQIVELNVMQGDQGRRVVLTETAYRGPNSIGRFITGAQRSERGTRVTFSAVRPREDSLIVADQLGEVSFSYLTEPRRPGDESEWIAAWDDANRLPAAIRVSMAPAQREARLQPVTVIGQVRARYEPPGSMQNVFQFDPRTMEYDELPNGQTVIRLKGNNGPRLPYP